MKNDQSTPLALTGGWKPTVSLRLHWISVTFKRGFEVSNHPNLPMDRVEARPMNAYNTAVRYSDGRIELSHTSRPEMGTHIVASGSVCDGWEIEPIEVLSHWINAGATVSRLDLAVDAQNFNLKPERATEEIENGNIVTRAREYPTWKDAKGKAGYTQYVGKKSSEMFVRIYNKAAEMGIEGDYTRVELSLKSKRADKAAWHIVRGSDFREILVGFVDFPKWGEWREVMGIQAVKLPYEKPLSQTEKWLLSACAPSLARQLYLAGDDGFWFKFVEAVRLEREKLEASDMKVS